MRIKGDQDTLVLGREETEMEAEPRVYDRASA